MTSPTYHDDSREPEGASSASSDTPPPISLVVIGRTNTGKSTLVATLTEDDSVRISHIPRTTTTARRWVIHIDNRPVLSVIDTPGFEDAVGALGRIKALSQSAADRAAAVRTFVEQAERDDEFLAERRLLRPVLEGGVILYVADASYPWRSNFQAELEILRWTGQPSVGLINRTGDGQYGEQWRNALEQYVKIVREISAKDATWDERIELLRDVAGLRVQWREDVRRIADELKEQWDRRRYNAALSIASLMYKALTHTRRERVANPDDLSVEKHHLEDAFAQDLRRMEQHCQRAVERAYGFQKLSRAGQADIHAPRLQEDLFSKAAWDDLGLSTSQLVAGAAAGGALSGLGVDAMFGGHSLGVGALIGSVFGAGGAVYYQRDQIPRATENLLKKMFSAPGSSSNSDKNPRRLIVVGPHKGPNFPWVLLCRALGHWYAVEARTHAHEGALDVCVPLLPAVAFPTELRKKLQRYFQKPKKPGLGDFEKTLLELYQSPTVQNALMQASDQED